MPGIESMVVAPTPSVTKSRVGKSKRNKRSAVEGLAPTPSVTKSRVGESKRSKCSGYYTDLMLEERTELDTFDTMVFKNNYDFAHRRALDALELYKRNKGAEFEGLQVYYHKKSGLAHPQWKDGIQYWAHVYFTAIPKMKSGESSSSDVSPKHFLGELLKDDDNTVWHAKQCNQFEPSNDPGEWLGCSSFNIAYTPCRIQT